MPHCQGVRVPVKQWVVCDCSIPGHSTLWDLLSLGRTSVPGLSALCLRWHLSRLLVPAALSAILSLVLHPSSQRSSRVSGDSLRAEIWQHPPLTGGQMLLGHEQTNRHQPNRARAQMAEWGLAGWRPSHKLAMLNRGPLLVALGQNKVIPVCSPRDR